MNISKKIRLFSLFIIVPLLFAPAGRAVADRAALVTNIGPSADFAFVPDEPVAGKEVQFVDFSTDPDGQIKSWQWDFGDGWSSQEREPLYSYSLPGTYTVTLTVTDDTGAQDSLQKEIPVSRSLENLVIQIAVGIVCVAGVVVAYVVGRKEKPSAYPS